MSEIKAQKYNIDTWTEQINVENEENILYTTWFLKF